jgi:hypothetical protein
MPTPDTITVTTVDPIDSVTVSPNPTIDSVDVTTVQDVSNIDLGFDSGVTNIGIADDLNSLDVNVSMSDIEVTNIDVSDDVATLDVNLSSFDYGVTSIDVLDDPSTLDVTISLGDIAIPVTSVNGKTGAVVIDYPDIGANPVNHVRFVFTQASIPTIQTSGPFAGSYIWTINHNLNFYPNITVFDSGNNSVETHVSYTNSNTAIIIMNSAISGTAYLS